MKKTIIALIAALPLTAIAQVSNTWSTVKMDGGWRFSADSYGNSTTSVPLGYGSYSHFGSNGFSAQTYGMGNGYSTTIITNPGYPSNYGGSNYGSGYPGYNW